MASTFNSYTLPIYDKSYWLYLTSKCVLILFYKFTKCPSGFSCTAIPQRCPHFQETCPHRAHCVSDVSKGGTWNYRNIWTMFWLNYTKYFILIDGINKKTKKVILFCNTFRIGMTLNRHTHFQNYKYNYIYTENTYLNIELKTPHVPKKNQFKTGTYAHLQMQMFLRWWFYKNNKESETLYTFESWNIRGVGDKN